MIEAWLSSSETMSAPAPRVAITPTLAWYPLANTSAASDPVHSAMTLLELGVNVPVADYEPGGAGPGPRSFHCFSGGDANRRMVAEAKVVV